MLPGRLLPLWGELTPSGVTNTCPTNYRFTGYERDPETAVGGINGLDYAIGRYYNSRIGRFMSPDPIDGDPSGPQSWNAYSYVVNNPLNAIDPLGSDTVFQVWSMTDSPSVFGGGFGPQQRLGGAVPRAFSAAQAAESAVRADMEQGIDL